jgi:flagellin-like hook-associated protein FlgL
MANDLLLMFHATTAAGATFAAVSTTGPVVDLGSNSVNRTLLLERRIVSGTGTLDITFQDSSDNSTFVNMPGTTSSANVGFARATTSSYASTDAIAPSGPNAVAKIVIRTDKRYVRATFTTATTNTWGGVSVVGKVMSGAFSGQDGPIDS